MRGEKKGNPEIVVVTIEQNLFYQLQKRNTLPSVKEFYETTDAHYWDPFMWTELLKQIFAQKPKVVGVTLFFGDSLSKTNHTVDESHIFYDPRVIWGSLYPHTDKPIFPLMSKYDHSNVGSIELIQDEDGVTRRFASQGGEVPHLVERMIDNKLKSHLINYQGVNTSFKEIRASDILNNNIDKDYLTNKYIIIGAEVSTSSVVVSPLGKTTRQMVLAQILDNHLDGRYIKRVSKVFYVIGLLILLILTLYIVTIYPRNVAIFILLWLGTLVTSLSLWIFDSFYFWIPIVSPLVQIGTTWILFLGYQANRIERKNFELQQEQKYLNELEVLKNNFVSLISHDLKTPIAKIHSVVDRLMTTSAVNEYRPELLTLRESGDELNRYIQSILKILRIESRDFRLNLEIVDINELIHDVILQVSPLLSEKNLTLSKTLEPLFSIEADLTLIREVILNLLENASKYTPNGGKIYIHSFEEADFIHVEFTDSGEGISPEELPHVWGKFVRGKDQNLKTKGTGLGLYLVKYFIELHGGKVNMESELGKGTSVRFSLPVN